MHFQTQLEDAENNVDILDAVICILAGADFLRSRCYCPERKLDQATKEGWIWVKRKEEAP